MRSVFLHRYWIVLPVLVLFGLFARCAPVDGRENDFPDLYKVICVGQVAGCSCLERPGGKEELRLFHYESVVGTGATKDGLQLIKHKQRECWYPAGQLERSEYAKVLTSPLQKKDHAPLPLARLVPGLSAGDALDQVKAMPTKDLGHFWATFYHLALEDFHPGPAVPVRSPAGKVLGHASKDFLEQVRWEGSGISKSGLRLHWAGRSLRFNLYPAGLWGHGAGYGYKVFPYRTIAVNFPGLCRRLKGPGVRCYKKDVIGVLVRIREVAERRIKMEDGSRHDGYFCATDTGSPNYIKEDRIDIFVGVHGGGNPYLPPGRRGNLLIDGGIRNLVPSDWRLWKSKKQRVWCPMNKIPAVPGRPGPGDCAHDYHTVAADKALRLEAVLRPDGRPLRCRKSP